jgi:hypothetical protein
LQSDLSVVEGAYLRDILDQPRALEETLAGLVVSEPLRRLAGNLSIGSPPAIIGLRNCVWYSQQAPELIIRYFFFCCAFTFAHRARCAAAIFFRSIGSGITAVLMRFVLDRSAAAQRT